MEDARIQAVQGKRMETDVEVAHQGKATITTHCSHGTILSHLPGCQHLHHHHLLLLQSTTQCSGPKAPSGGALQCSPTTVTIGQINQRSRCRNFSMHSLYICHSYILYVFIYVLSISPLKIYMYVWVLIL